MITASGESAVAVVKPTNAQDAIISHIDRICSACHRLIIGFGRICFECREDHHPWCVVPCLRCGVLICVMCSRLHECGGDDVTVRAGRSSSFSGNDHRNHTVDDATPVSGKLPSVVCPVSGWLPTAKIPCKFHIKQCCRCGGECNFTPKPNCGNNA